MPISTHVLDTTTGAPAKGVELFLEVYEESDNSYKALITGTTNDDGRMLLFPNDSLNTETLDLLAKKLKDQPDQKAKFRLNFQTEKYQDSIGKKGTNFFPEVNIVFLTNPFTEKVHVPLLLSAYGYTTYRGS